MTSLNSSYMLLADAHRLYYTDRKPAEAIAKIDEALETNKMSYAYALKSIIQRDLGKNEEALKTVEEGLGYDPNDHVLLRIQAEILAYVLAKYDKAYAAVQKAQACFVDSRSKNRKLLMNISVFVSEESLTDYLGTKADLNTLQSNITTVRFKKGNGLRIWYNRVISNQP